MSQERPTHPTTTDGVWRVMRFENAEGKWAELASNHVGPEAVPVPPGYKFVGSTPMVPDSRARADERQRIVERLLHAANLLDPDEVSRTALTLEKMAAVLVVEGGQA
jgi:hypothetical protein